MSQRELQCHAAIADHFGYKLSIHFGSDKFSVYPLIGRYTNGPLPCENSRYELAGGCIRRS
ncbi:tagaturonate epimerase family protein [Paenibacillus filicis]|uniref:Tagaturonate epimerase family protein n=1 Tax=Paenibacillus filicis TaxID=669464 RepID=A0ABU9DM09_9BACL